MKKIIFLILLLLSFATITAQNNITMSSGKARDTLKTGKAIFHIKPDATGDYSFTIWLQTLSGTDTVFCSTTARDTSAYSSKVLIDLSTGSPVSSMIITTTAKEYLIYDPMLFKIKLSTTHALVSTLFKISRK